MPVTLHQHPSPSINCGQDARAPTQPQSIAKLIRNDQAPNVRAPVTLHQHPSPTINCGQDARAPTQPQSIAELIRNDQAPNVRAPVMLHQHPSPSINCGQDARAPRRSAVPFLFSWWLASEAGGLYPTLPVIETAMLICSY